MTGPVESALRARMRSGRTITRRDAVREIGVLAGVFFDRLVKAGAVAIDDSGRAALREVARVAPIDTAWRQRERARLAEIERARQVEREMAEWREQNRRRKLAAERALFSGLDGYSPEERAVVLAERIAALAESQPAAESQELARVG